MRKEISACGTDGSRARKRICTSEGTCARTRKPFCGTDTRLYPYKDGVSVRGFNMSKKPKRVHVKRCILPLIELRKIYKMGGLWIELI